MLERAHGTPELRSRAVPETSAWTSRARAGARRRLGASLEERLAKGSALAVAGILLACGQPSEQRAVESASGSGGAGATAGAGAMAGAGSSGGATGTTASGGASASGAGGGPGACQEGTTSTTWATSCQVTRESCTAGTWRAPRDGGETRAPLRHESEHFAIYWPEGTDITLGQAEAAAETLEGIWSAYFGSPIFFPEPYCSSADKWKAAVHFDNDFPLWGGGWTRNGISYMGMWIGPGAARDRWGLAHELMHGVQSTTQAFPECGGVGCWIFESHANWMPHQIWRDDVHCSEMLPNMPHLYYGNTRDRYCNWQFFEFLKDKHCHGAVNDMWAFEAPSGQRDPWQKLMLSRGWDIEQLNDLFGEWAMHNITWDYKDPPPTDGADRSSVYRQAYGSIETDPTSRGRTERRLRLTRLEALDADWAQDRRFVSPYHWAPQRWGYNVVRLHPEPGATSVQVEFRGVTQADAESGWRWGLVATDPDLTRARYSPLQRGADGALSFCVNPGENVYLVVVATPTEYQKLVWTNPSDGPAYPSIYRYPYMVQVDGAWPAGFQDGQVEACSAGTVRHSNGGGCAPPGTPSSVYVGPYARILGGEVSGDVRVEDHATIVNGTISGGRIGALSLVGQGGAGIQARDFDVSGSAVVQTTFYPLGWFGGGQSVSGTARLLGDVEFVATSKSSNTFYGFVPGDWTGVSSVAEVTVAPPYAWRP
ncbi:DUF6055 domain-containing protein [Sorangium cellulosum]|uniref:Sugar-binding protein n=1 Tax=Sorangium cellulosum TaxID=56 RepID=A0A150Q9S9_SORCE|nr:DUF6055 domain-containing protein [Sorangium cellulosum]KYF64729.1 sugar-binding protein [Sorangium cellulosum]